MSFILDALKKLEQNRKNISVPDILSDHNLSTTIKKKRIIWPYLLLVALLLNAGILALWLIPGATEKKVVSELTSKPDTVIEHPEKLDKIDNKDKVLKPTNEDSSQRHISNKVADNKQSETLPDIKHDEKKDEEHAQVEQEISDNPASSTGINLSDHELEVLRNKIIEERSAASELPAKENLLTDRSHSDSDIPEYSQLSAEVKKNIPKISISGHIYSNNSSARIVNINGSIIREGESIETGLKLEEITISGAVFSYNGSRFSMKAF